jgi:hypothetical protein
LKLELLEITTISFLRSFQDHFRDNRWQFSADFNKRQAIIDLENKTLKLTLGISPIEAVN